MEFGSDFQLIEYPKGYSIVDIYKNANFYLDGRQAIIDLVKHNRWRQLWVPTYYCHDFLKDVSEWIPIRYYDTTPESNCDISKYDISEHDAIVVMNYFGQSQKPLLNTKAIVIEDHSHDLISNWAKLSNAHWCFGSLRKTLPIADGGILWSPRSLPLPPIPNWTIEGNHWAETRYYAMELKSSYLNGNQVDKEVFRRIYIDSEEMLSMMPISGISKRSYSIVAELDIEKWYEHKRSNWTYMLNHLHLNNNIDVWSNQVATTPFSVILKCKTQTIRDELRNKLIKQSVYPAILWDIPHKDFVAARNFSQTMLSIHCDGRYKLDEIEKLIAIINNTIACLK